MKYIKILILFCVMLSFFSARLRGQNTNEITLESAGIMIRRVIRLPMLTYLETKAK